MKVIEGDITDIVKGVIVHQVNCQNVIGAGVSGALIRKYREVKTSYHDVFRNENPFYLFGKFREVAVTEDLLVVHAFSQFGYGNAAKTGKVYTDMEKLEKSFRMSVKNIRTGIFIFPAESDAGLPVETGRNL